MKTYKVVLMKSYTVKVKASTTEKAKHLAEFYTGDIEDISAPQDRKKSGFSIGDIECLANESLCAEEVLKVPKFRSQ